jgi:hypothetical protein
MTSIITASVIGFSVILGGIAAASDAKVTQYEVSIPQQFYVKYQGNNQQDFPNGFKTGFGSGIALKSVGKDGSLEFYMISDRGPNADGPIVKNEKGTFSGKFFPAPNFQPTIAIGVLKAGKIAVRETIGLKNYQGKPLTGLPITPGFVGSSYEVALSENLKDLGYDDNGLDSEGVAVDARGNFWVCDEYGPFIIQFDKTGKLLRKYAPGSGLPELLKYRIPNRGFEGITVAPNGKVYAALQSVLNINEETDKTAQFTRIVELNPATGETKMYAYPIDIDAYKSPKGAKVGDIYAISDTKLLLIEQGSGKDKQMRNLIYLVDLTKATDISDMTINGKEPEYVADKSQLPGITFASKSLVFDLKANGWNVEKAEGLTMLPDKKTIVVVNDNDFGMMLNLQDTENKNAEIGDYTLTTDGTLKVKDKAANPVLKIVPNSEVEQNMYMWVIELPKALQ